MTELLQALLTPVIAITTTYVAYQQYRIRRDERAIVLYDRRLAIFKTAVAILDRVMAGKALTTEEVFSWASLMTEARFLFGKEVQAVIDPLFEALFDYAVESEPVIKGKPYNSFCANAALGVEAFRVPLTEVFSTYLYPSSAPLWVKRRLSVKRVNKLISEAAPHKNMASNVEGEIPF